MRDIKRIAVYCGSAAGASEIYRLEAVKFARILVEQELPGLRRCQCGDHGDGGGYRTPRRREGHRRDPALLEGREIAHKT